MGLVDQKQTYELLDGFYDQGETSLILLTIM